MKRHSASAVMLAASFAYIVSVTTRSSLAVAAIPASEKFHVSASALGALVVFQVMVYTIMQIPVGVLLDRFGAKSLLILGAGLMAIGQLVVAHADVIQTAYLGRLLVGIGDSFSFVSMVRLIYEWNDSKRASRLQQFMTNIGQGGQIISAIPFAILLAQAGWQNAFSVAAMFALLSAVLVAILIGKNSPHEIKHAAMSIRKSVSLLVENIRFSGTRMCFWIMFVSQSSGTVFALFWGVPFLIKGQGQNSTFASTMLFAQFAIALIGGVILGWISVHRSNWRVRIFLTVGFAQVASWVVLGLLPGKAPTWALLAVVFTIAMGAPTSMIAMDFSKQIISAERRGSANGFINVGGHLASFIMMALAGFALDAVQAATGSSSPFTFDGFRIAMSTQVIVLLAGLSMFWLEYRKTKAAEAI